MKTNWLHSILLAPMDDYSGGGSGVSFQSDDDDDDDGDEIIDAEEEERDEDEDDDDDEPAGKKGFSGFDQTAFAKAIADGIRPSLQQQQPQKQYTREEIEQQLGKPKLSVDLIRQLRDPEVPVETALAAFEQLLNGQAEYLLKASGMAIEGRVGELNPRLDRLQQHYVNQQEEKFVTGVTRKYPALKGKGNAVKQALAQLKQQGYQPASESAAKRDVAKFAAQLIKQFDGNFTLKPKAQQQFMRPGAGGGARGQQAPRGRSVIDSVFQVGK